MTTSRTALAFLLVALVVMAGCASERSAWEDAQAEDSVASYEAFLDEYPDGELSGDARARIQAFDYDAAQAADSVSAFEDFLARYPDSELVDQATERIQALRILARAGQWDGKTSFGSMSFVVSPSGEEVTDLKMDWAFGGISGEVTFSDNFSLPIDESGRFEITVPDALVFWGEFSAERPMATGYFEKEVPMRREPLSADWEIVREVSELAGVS